MKSKIEFRKVSKKIGNKQILDQIDLTIAEGEIVGIIGANGSGKTTMLRLISGLMYPDDGQLFVSGTEVSPRSTGKLPFSVGALIESPSFLPHFSGFKNLMFLAGIQDKIGERKVRETIERVGLDPTNRKRVSTYSLGMRQRLGIAQAVMEDPDVLVFDEPTNGLDSDGVKMFSQLLRDQVNRGAAVVIVSHVEHEINSFCDRVYKIESGGLKQVRDRRERKWLVVAKNLQSLEIIYHLIPSFEIGNRVNGLPAGVCKGDWTTKEELREFLETQGIFCNEVQEVS